METKFTKGPWIDLRGFGEYNQHTLKAMKRCSLNSRMMQNARIAQEGFAECIFD